MVHEVAASRIQRSIWRILESKMAILRGVHSDVTLKLQGAILGRERRV